MSRTRMRRLGGALVVAGIMGALLGPVPAANAQVAFPDADFSGYATGSVVHTDLINQGTTRVENTDIAYSGASVNSKGLTAPITNEMARVVQPAQAGKKAYARGAGIEVGLVQAPTADGQVLLAGKAEASAPPTTIAAPRQIAVQQDPALSVQAAIGNAAARWNDNACMLGQDLARGFGSVADAQLVDVDTAPGTDPGLEAPIVATDATNPDRDVVTSISRNKLVPQTSETGAVVGPNFGLMSQVDQTIAPIRLNVPPDTNPANDILIEVGGVWRLTTVATGIAGQAWIHYGPLAAEPQTIVLKIQQGTGTPTMINLQQITGPTGLVVPLPSSLGEIVIGEDPRKIGGTAADAPTEGGDGTLVAAAVDVLRIKLAAVPGLADIRVGHMEAKAQVPAGGVICNIPVSKDADPREVFSPGSFLYNIEVDNSNSACELQNVVLTDTIRVKSGNPQFAIDETDPRNDPKPTSVTADKKGATWELGTIAAGAKKKVVLVVQAISGAGVLENTARATGLLNCPDATAMGEANVKVPLVGSVVVEIPRVDMAAVLPRTGGPLVAPIALALFGGAAAVRWVRRRINDV